MNGHPSAGMPDGWIERERAQALHVRDALHRIRKQVAVRGPVTPSDLSVQVRKSGHKCSHLFMWMAVRAVGGKYQLAHEHAVSAKLQVLGLAIERYFRLGRPSWEERERFFTMGGRLGALCGGYKRISHYQSRHVCGDMDIVLCVDGIRSLDWGVTPWVCQRPDLRYRWTGESMLRLAYLADCWDAYSRCDFTWNDRFTGFSDFPLHPEYVRPRP